MCTHVAMYAHTHADSCAWVRCGLLKVEWFHVLDPRQWSVITVEGRRVQEGIVFLQTQPAISLLKHCLSVKNDLMHADLLRCARLFELDCSASVSRTTLLQVVAQAVGGAEFAELCAKVDTASLDEDPLLQDPLLELAYDELEEDDQLEFRDLRQAFKERKVRDRINSWRAARNLPHIACAKKRARGLCAQRPRKRQRVQGANAALADGPAGSVGDEGAPDPIPVLDNPGAPGPDGGGEGALEPIAESNGFMDGVGNEGAPQPIPLPAIPGEDAGVLPPVADPDHRARAQRGDVLHWDTVDCAKCGTLHIGEYKYDHAPGGRAPVWVMRVILADGTWPNMGRTCFSTRRTSIVGETDEFALRWIQEHRTCCAD